MIAIPLLCNMTYISLYNNDELAETSSQGTHLEVDDLGQVRK